jgi:hypothetical protein
MKFGVDFTKLDLSKLKEDLGDSYDEDEVLFQENATITSIKDSYIKDGYNCK